MDDRISAGYPCNGLLALVSARALVVSPLACFSLECAALAQRTPDSGRLVRFTGVEFARAQFVACEAA